MCLFYDCGLHFCSIVEDSSQEMGKYSFSENIWFCNFFFQIFKFQSWTSRGRWNDGKAWLCVLRHLQMGSKHWTLKSEVITYIYIMLWKTIQTVCGYFHKSTLRLDWFLVHLTLRDRISLVIHKETKLILVLATIIQGTTLCFLVSQWRHSDTCLFC